MGCEDCGRKGRTGYCESCGKNPVCSNCLTKWACGHYVCKGCKEYQTDGKFCHGGCENQIKRP